MTLYTRNHWSNLVSQVSNISISSSPAYLSGGDINIWGYLSFLTNTVMYEGTITKQNVCFVMLFIVEFLILRRLSGSSVYRGIMVLGSPENHWRFCLSP